MMRSGVGPRSCRWVLPWLLLVLACGGGSARAGDDAEAPVDEFRSGREDASGEEREPAGAADGQTGVPVWGYEVVHSYPHDARAFTQGLLYHDGYLYEGTGRRGESTVRKVRLETGEVLERVELPASVFGEGIALLGSRLYQLTWLAGVGFVYELEGLERVGEFRQFTEGWGLTAHGGRLVMSDGSARLYFLDPETMRPERTVEVREEGRPIEQLNELESVDGEIWANVWHSDHLLRISPADGRVLGRIDLAELLEPHPARQDPEAVLNGIAYDPETGRIFVTGKRWPRLFEIRMRTSAP